MASDKKKVAYYYDEEIGNFYFGEAHPMKPHRMRMTHNLIIDYGMYKDMQIFRPYALHEADMTAFHSDDYIHFLQRVSPETSSQYDKELRVFCRNDEHSDCPVFDGLFKFCQLSAGGSVGGACKLNSNSADIVINWAGGLHHAKKSEAAGFCYINDIVLGILELLKYHARVVYIDIDIHHGDGVEEAFYTTDRVMTVSFHKGGDFFPGTGKVQDCGLYGGKGYALNFPLHDGMDDDCYRSIFQPIITRVMEFYQPGAVVLQCGADSLSGDRLGCFNLSMKGHGECIEFVKTFNVPVLVLGGGGYTIRNVARCWAYETSICIGKQLDDNLPYNEYYEYYAPDFQLHITTCDMDNYNTQPYLDSVTRQLLEQLRGLPHAPSVQMHNRPAPALRDVKYAENEPDPDQRVTQGDIDNEVQHESEFFNGEADQDATGSNPEKPSAAPKLEQEKEPPATQNGIQADSEPQGKADESVKMEVDGSEPGGESLKS
eukprot:110360_1